MLNNVTEFFAHVDVGAHTLFWLEVWQRIVPSDSRINEAIFLLLYFQEKNSLCFS